MPRIRLKCLLVGLTMIVGVGRVSASAPTPKYAHLTRAEIISTIHKAVNYLRRTSKPGSFWEYSAPNNWAYGGPTALATYALLQAGLATGDSSLSPDSSFMRPAVKFLVKLHPRGTYVAGLQLAALTSEPISIPGYYPAIHRAADFLIDSEHNNGAYDYYWSGKKPHEPIPSRWDNSNTQYGVLGVWCAEAGGYIYPPISYWRMAEKHWRKCQNPDGGWCYQSGGASTRSMTAAGLATLYITDQYLHPEVLNVLKPNSAVKRGLAWLSKHIRTRGNLYYLYGLERVGLASGLRYIGGYNWYRMGARIILKTQSKPGEWDAGVVGAANHVIPTAYALLFLSRGLNPVIFNKLSYPGYWNLRPHDDQNITTWIGNTLEENLNWGVADIHSNPHHWLNAPILLITGDRAVTFNSRQIARLRRYVQGGGIIFSVTENDSRAFEESMHKIAAEVFPGRAMAAVPFSSSLYQIQYEISSRQFPLLGVRNSVRWLWIQCPVDLSAAWQTMATVTEAGCFELAENIDLYATGEQKPVTHLYFDHPWRKKKPGYELQAAFIHIGEPGETREPPDAVPIKSLCRFALHHGVKITYSLARYADLPVPTRTPVSYIMVSAGGKLSAATRRAVAHYIRGGGCVIMEDTKGSPLEYHHLRRMLAREFPSHPLQRMDQSILRMAVAPEVPIRHLQYTSFWTRYHGPSEQAPVYVMRLDHRIAAIITTVNLSEQWTGQNYWTINGLAASSARKAALDLLILAARQKRGGLKILRPATPLALVHKVARPKQVVAPAPVPTPTIPLPPTIELH
ncbi:MAG: DUF4159 domain-containing protein [Phycisphaerae bacterium]